MVVAQVLVVPVAAVANGFQYNLPRVIESSTELRA